MSTFVWLGSTAVLFVATVIAINVVEAAVPKYSVRLVVMLFAGLAIGALASAVGYSFFALTLLLALYLWRMRTKLAIVSGSSQVGNKYALPSLVLVVAATLASFVFSVESCSTRGEDCKRVFFERIYTPPHLAQKQ